VRVALLPLDERPVNTTMVADIGRIAGAMVLLPPTTALPRFREPGDTDALGAWLAHVVDEGLAGAVVSLDMLGYGGLVASRTSHDTAAQVLARLSLLERIHAAHPTLHIGALNVFLRASNSDNASEEPDYWTDYGRLLHRLGGRVHEAWTDSPPGSVPRVEEPLVPADVRQDFARRRMRNHVVNLAGLELAHNGTVSTLLLTADDTAPRSAGSAEQSLVDYWTTLLEPHDSVLIYPGADEVAAVMTTRLLSRHHDVVPTFTVTCVDPGGLERVAPYENAPIATGVHRQVVAAGGRVVESGADVRLVVHAPSPTGGDFYGTVPDRTDPALVSAIVETVDMALAAGERIAVADCRFPNGADPALVEGLRDAGVLLRLEAYGGWNTAGNTVGSVVAAAGAAVVGRRSGMLDPDAQQGFLLHRLLEDYGYQARVRNELLGRPDHEALFLPGSAGDTAAHVHERLDEVLRELGGSTDLPWRVGAVAFPWDRAFEIDLRLEHTGTARVAT
jgi:hypothetical protein